MKSLLNGSSAKYDKCQHDYCKCQQHIGEFTQRWQQLSFGELLLFVHRAFDNQWNEIAAVQESEKHVRPICAMPNTTNRKIDDDDRYFRFQIHL